MDIVEGSRINLSSYLVGAAIFLLTWIACSLSWKLKEAGRKIDRFPGPFSIPILGSLILMFIPRTGILPAILKWTKKYNGNFRLWILNRPLIFLSTPDAVQKVLGSKDHVEKAGHFYELFKFLVGNGLVTADVPSWKQHRRMLLGAVTGKMVNVFVEVCNDKLPLFRKMVASAPGVGETNMKVNLHPYIHRLAFDIICDTIYGKGINTLETSSFQFIEAGSKNKNVNATQMYSPWLRWNWLWKLHPDYKLMKEITDQTGFLLNEVIPARKILRKERESENDGFQSDKKGEACRGKLLDLLLDAVEDPSNDATEEYIRGELITFLSAGFETSTEAILWTLFLLGNNLDIQEKLYQELVHIFGANKEPTIHPEDLDKLPYLDKCVKESLRLYPAIPMVLRTVQGDVQIDPDLIIPSGTDVAISFSAVHQNPQVFPNPTAFNPERFSPEENEKRHPYDYIPFSMGPRNCIGKKFGEIMSRFAIAMFLLNFKVISCQKPEDVKLLLEVSLGPAETLYFYVEKR